MRFYLEPTTGLPHIHGHGVRETEVIDVLEFSVEDRPGSDGSRLAIGRASTGRYLRVVYVPDVDGEGMFVVTAYELQGKPLAAFRRRRRRRK